ncbi:hypothetical protein Z945_2806 [Sulfitobacter noctilucae]|nr:hypothetical protein [Sulfitobacter noctilucae]KIN61812.1 hypothetical protein Z945_2806 [Sulfitobacter noctilucae]
MNTHDRDVVIGGRGVGASVLYHLAKLGWTDVTPVAFGPMGKAMLR